MARAILVPEAGGDWSQTFRCVSYLEFATGRVMVDYVHPAALCAGPLLIYGLLDAAREITTA